MIIFKSPGVYTKEYFYSQVLEFNKYLTTKDYFYEKPEIIVNAFRGLTAVYFNTEPNPTVDAAFLCAKTDLERRSKYSFPLMIALTT
jgi:hypothetical protein